MDRFVALYRDHLKFVWRVLWRARAPDADIRDLAHDVFIVVLRKLRESDPAKPGPGTEDDERAWLYLIAIFELNNYRRGTRYRRVELMDDHTDEIPDARNDAARLEAQDELRTLLDSLPRDRREMFELVELEDVSVIAAAKALGITETNAHTRLANARKDMRAAAAKLAQRNQDAGKKTSMSVLPFGVGAWLQLRDLANPPEGTTDLIWKRIQDTMAAIDREDDRAARPAPEHPPTLPRVGPLVKKLARQLIRPLKYVGAACIGGAIVALFFLLRPNARIAIVRFPVVFVTNSTATPAPLPAPSSSSTSMSTEAIPTADAMLPTADATIDEEALLIRQARAAYAAGNVPKSIKAFNDYERLFPAGQFRRDIREMRARLTAAGGR